MKNNKRVLFERFPVTYSTLSDFSDSRFLKVRVKVMHTGLNLNNSFFSGEAVQKAEKSCRNIPLLAYTKKVDGAEGSDFAGHEYELKITKDGLEYVYLGRPIGMIPESNNYTLETDEDGRTFACVDGYIWTDYANEALKIIERDQMKKVSMEILVDDYEFTETHVNIHDYRYTGIALLGDDVNEAMIGAKLEVAQFSTNRIQEMQFEINSALVSLFQATPPAEEPTVEDTFEVIDIVEPIVEPVVEPVVEETVTEPTDPIVEPVVEDTVVPVVVDPVDETMFSADETDPEKISPPLDENPKTDEGVSTILMSEQEFSELKIQHAELQAQFEALKAELESLSAFKLLKEEETKALKKQKIDELFTQFEDVSKCEGFDSITALADLEEFEMLETRLFALRGKFATVDNSAGKIPIAAKFADEPEFYSLVRKHIQK